MSILNKHLPFVKYQFAFQTKRAEIYGSGPKADVKRQKLHLVTAEKFKTLEADLVEADKILDDPARAPKPITLAQQLNLFPTELDGLPPELLEELSVSDADRIERAILSQMEETGGIISLDRLLVGLYKKTGDIHKRVTMTSRLYRMNQKGYVYPVPGKKGVYSIRQMSEDEVAKLFAVEAIDNTETS